MSTKPCSIHCRARKRVLLIHGLVDAPSSTAAPPMPSSRRSRETTSRTELRDVGAAHTRSVPSSTGRAAPLPSWPSCQPQGARASSAACHGPAGGAGPASPSSAPRTCSSAPVAQSRCSCSTKRRRLAGVAAAAGMARFRCRRDVEVCERRAREREREKREKRGREREAAREGPREREREAAREGEGATVRVPELPPCPASCLLPPASSCLLLPRPSCLLLPPASTVTACPALGPRPRRRLPIRAHRP